MGGCCSRDVEGSTVVKYFRRCKSSSVELFHRYDATLVRMDQGNLSEGLDCEGTKGGIKRERGGEGCRI